MPRGKKRKPIERIQVSKGDEIALVVERIIDAQADEVVLTIPRFSKIAESPANFHLIKRESDLLEKNIIIESVDDKVIELAKNVELESVNPILIQRRQFSDIVSTAQVKKQPAVLDDTPPVQEEKPPREAITEDPMDAEDDGDEGAPQPKKRLKMNVSMPKLPKVNVSMPKLPRTKRSWIILAGLIVVIFVLSLIARALPRVDIQVVTAKTPWQFEDSVTLSKDAGTAQVFHDERNLNASFPASGKDIIEKQATGKLLVFNAYSSDSQPLVRRTRFVTPDGKVYRLTESITVPPAKVVAGEITPSSIEADVIADEAGDEFNTGPVERLSVPGFKGTPKYSGFYGRIEDSITGGKIGEVAVPTDDDIRVAKENVTSRVQQVLEAAVFSSLPGEFVVADGASSFAITKQDVIEDTDSEGNFSVFTEAEMDVIAFMEEDVVSMLQEKMREELGEEYGFHEYTLNYGEATTDFGDGSITIPVTFEGSAYRPVDVEELRAKIQGLSEDDLQVTISSLPGFEEGKVSFWPFWVKAVPDRESRVRIDIL